MLEKIVSGGQTGVDRAALDIALELGYEQGGWCPAGRRSESGPIPLKYSLHETESNAYQIRTVRNVIDSDATLIVYYQELSGGSLFTKTIAEQKGKPLFLIDAAENYSKTDFQNWLDVHSVKTLNIAGPRRSSAPLLYKIIHELLRTLLIRPR